MDGLILLFLVVVAIVFVVPAVALAKVSRALRAIEELKQRLLMLVAPGWLWPVRLPGRQTPLRQPPKKAESDLP